MEEKIKIALFIAIVSSVLNILFCCFNINKNDNKKLYEIEFNKISIIYSTLIVFILSLILFS
jgi:hypothetical protein